MKKLFTLFALTLVAAISINASAQSSKLVGKWKVSNSAQAAMLQAVGGEIERSVSTMTFYSNGTSESYDNTKASAYVMDVKMDMTLEMKSTASWTLNGNELTSTVNDIEIIYFDIQFSDVSMNAMVDEIKATLQDALTQGKGVALTYGAEFITNDEVVISFDNEFIPMEYTLTRIE